MGRHDPNYLNLFSHRRSKTPQVTDLGYVALAELYGNNAEGLSFWAARVRLDMTPLGRIHAAVIEPPSTGAHRLSASHRDLSRDKASTSLICLSLTLRFTFLP